MMDLPFLETSIKVRYDVLADAVKDHFDNALAATSAKAEIEKVVAILYAEGKVEGKNATARDANVKVMLKDSYDCLEVLVEDERHAYLRKQLAEIDVAKYRAILRIAELADTEKQTTHYEKGEINVS